MSDVEAFIAALSKESLEKCTKEHLIKLAEYYSVTLGEQCLKDNVKVASKSKLVESGVMSADQEERPPISAAFPIQTQGLTFRQQRELLHMQTEHDKLKLECTILEFCCPKHFL